MPTNEDLRTAEQAHNAYLAMAHARGALLMHDDVEIETVTIEVTLPNGVTLRTTDQP